MKKIHLKSLISDEDEERELLFQEQTFPEAGMVLMRSALGEAPPNTAHCFFVCSTKYHFFQYHPRHHDI